MITAEAVSKKLLIMMPVSRLATSKGAPGVSFGARQANRINGSVMAKKSITRMKKPRRGSLANACTELSTPERTRKVPIRLKENAVIASSNVQLLNAPVRSVAIIEWIKAVATSQGISEAFSTGSQNQKPPMPSVSAVHAVSAKGRAARTHAASFRESSREAAAKEKAADSPT